MQNLSLLCIIFSLMSIQIYAQEPGKAGELLMNEIGNDKAAVIQNRESDQAVKKPRSTDNYQWSYNTGNSEVFIRIPERGRFTVQVADQSISNSNGKYRFFDLRAGISTVAIYQNDFLLYRTRINVTRNSRIMLDFFSDYGLYLLSVYPILNNPYGVNEWDELWNRPYDGRWNNPSHQFQFDTMNQTSFNRFMSTLKKESFDEGKIRLIESTAKDIYFTAEQIKEMISLFSFDDNKLDIAKKLYAQCVDKYNYYLVNEAFSFSSTKEKLQDYIRKIR
ncbi:MAG: DUF4476 domain-containing protein [Weeksellaceae bacterium]